MPSTESQPASLVNLSVAERVARLPKRERDRMVAKWGPDLLHSWKFWARPSQRMPDGAWDKWLVMAGRGFGKTRVGAETVRIWKSQPGTIIHLVGRTFADVRDVMVEGESGLLSILPKHERPRYLSNRGLLLWPNGSRCLMFSAEEPDRLRGPQCHKTWGDEVAAWRYREAWDNLAMGLRLGDSPQAVITTTPRPTPLIREFVTDPGTHLTRGSTYENRSNLAASFLDRILSKYEGTRLGRQELMAEILDDTPGALWRLVGIDSQRVREAPEFSRVVVAVDPAASANATSDETGIVVVGLGDDGHGYVLADYSMRGSPDEWAREVVRAFKQHKADRVVVEVNQGGDMVTHTLRTVDPLLPISTVHARRGKVLRAEPVAALYEQGRVHHVGSLATLEDQMTTWNPTDPKAKSPDRVDALVYGLTEILVVGDAQPGVRFV